MGSERASGAVVVGPSGRGSEETEFGDFLKSARKSRGANVTHITKQAGISRANYYHLENGQAPSLPTAFALLSALGMEARLPDGDDPDWDLEIREGEHHYKLQIKNWTGEERRRSRARMTAAGFKPWDAAHAASKVGAVAGVGALIAVAPGVAAGAAAVAAGAAAMGSAEAARLLRLRAKERKADRLKRAEPEGREAASEEKVRIDFLQAAEGMSTEDLEALLEAMKEMQAQGTQEG